VRQQSDQSRWDLVHASQISPNCMLLSASAAPCIPAWRAMCSTLQMMGLFAVAAAGVIALLNGFISLAQPGCTHAGMG
jgi:hypothetical protein